MDTDWVRGELGSLRWHWGSAYVIQHPEPDHWLAVRKDDRTMLHADEPDTLLSAIREDYQARPVPRKQAP